jgi:hypothetical protein
MHGIRKPALILAGALITLAATAAANGREFFHNYGTNSFVAENYVDFYTAYAEGTDGWPSYAFNPAYVAQKYYSYNLTATTGTACYEIETLAAAGDADPADTRIWTYGAGYKSLDDDSGPGLFSKARAYLSGLTALGLYFAAYSGDYNKMKFETKVTRLNLAEAACTTDQSLPWVKSKSNVTTYSANAN